jgi:ADP-L-glycero-D-manno-heptose 6-epimerase
MIVVTGGAGFIGYNLVKKLIELGHKDIMVVDNDLRNVNKNRIWSSPSCGHCVSYVSVETSYLWLGFNGYNIDVVYHLGARTDTMEKDEKIFERLNLNYSKFIWNLCSEFKIPLIYASSAATYGDGEDGFDDEEPIYDLKPLNAYGWSKQIFDLWTIEQESKPPQYYGLKFFNVYGNYEQHKGAMSSVIWHFYNQIKKTGAVKLFKSHVDFCVDGEQKRDFIHVSDVVNIMILLYNNRKDVHSDIYNLGTGNARTYNDLAKAVFKSLGKSENISYIDTPLEIKNSYQYYTRAKMNKLMDIISGYNFLTLEQGIDLYIKQLKYENS